MLSTYKAVLLGNRLEWSEKAPPDLPEGRPVRVSVTILEAAPSQAQAMADALERLARLNTVSSIADPVAWEREQREDRELPGRDS